MKRRAAPRLILGTTMFVGLFTAGCATTGGRGTSLLPTQYKAATAPFVVYANRPVDADAPAVRALEGLKNDLEAKLDCREADGAQPIEVYVLDDRSSFLHLLRFYFPELPPRRAFFLARGEQRIVYTYQGPRLEEDLRHEATHALLRGRFGDVPLWLDEGVAEYFEAGPDDREDRTARLARLVEDRKAGWSPDLARLESLADVHQMSPRDYRESWAWVDLLLSDPRAGATVLVDHLQRGRDAVHPEPLSTVLAARGADASTLLAHLERPSTRSIAQKPAPSATDDRASVVRMQDRSPDPPGEGGEPPRAGLLRRLAGLLGF